MEPKKYKVLKRFGDYKKGEEFDPIEDGYDGGQEDIDTAVTDGFLSEIVAGDSATDTTAKPATTATSATVEYPGGTRTFSLEIHGEDFASLAAEFAETNNGTVLA